ncbi:MAG TPA: class I SAM-dependent methyltransferase [Chloroflexota bacterium]|nr:class I SAM-dependent methyltransferase [Chloroflexota bacterium]
MSEQAAVKAYYARHAQREWTRLVRDPFHRLEFETTLRFLAKHLPASGLVLDAGGGPGRYTIELARRGYEVVLLDYTPECLELARRRIARAGLKRRVHSIEEGSIVDLSRFPIGHFDAVICLGGPLSHVPTEQDRRQAALELARVAKPGAPVGISVMGRLAVLAATPRYWPGVLDDDRYFAECWQTGDDRQWCGNSFSHFFWPDEFVTLLREAGLEILDCVGLEGLSSNCLGEVNRLARHQPGRWQVWLDAHAELCTHPSVFASSEHLLIMGRKPG